MDEGFCSCGGEGWTETGNVFEVEEGCLCDVFDVFVEGEGLIKDDSKIPDVRGGGFWETINIEDEVLGGFGERFWTNDDDFRFVAVEFEEI